MSTIETKNKKLASLHNTFTEAMEKRSRYLNNSEEFGDLIPEQATIARIAYLEYLLTLHGIDYKQQSLPHKLDTVTAV